MNAPLDLRRFRIGLEIDGRINFYEGMRVRVTGTKFAIPMQNECQVLISGLARQSRDYLLTESSPFNDNRTPKRLIVETGRVSTGLFRMFVGDIVSAEPSSPPDLDLTIKAKTGSAQAGNIVSVGMGGQQNLSEIAAQVAKQIGVMLEFDAQDKKIGNWQHSGAALKLVEKLAAAGGVTAYLDDDLLVVKDAVRPLGNRLIVVSQDTGMHGVPKITEKGIQVSILADPQAVIGGRIRVISKINPAVNGDYTINQIKYDLQSHETPYFYNILGERI